MTKLSLQSCDNSCNKFEDADVSQPFPLCGDKLVVKNSHDSFSANGAFVDFDDLNPPTSPKYIHPIVGKCNWKKEDLVNSPFWGLELTASDLEEIKRALAVCKTDGSGLDLQDGWQPLGVTQENFPLVGLGNKLREMTNELEHGTGAIMIKNMPVSDYSIEDIGIIYAGINSYIGRWVPQSSAGLRSKSRGFGLPLGRVEAEMSGNTPKNGLQANNYFRLHTDRCDVITLMCIRPAPAGGASRVCSAVHVHNTMLKDYPNLCARLYKPYYRIWEGVNGYFDLPVWSVHKGKFTTQVSILRMRSVFRKSLSSMERELKLWISLKKLVSKKVLSS